MRVLAFCDGGGSIGVGHVMRSLALAEAAVAAGHHVVLAGLFEGTFLAGQLAAAPVEVVPLAPSVTQGDPQDLIELVGRLHPDVVHVDSYEATDRLRELVLSPILSSMEDGTFGRRAADVVVDPTLGAELSARADDGSTWLLRGSRYTPVRQRVIDARLQREADVLDGPRGISEGEVAHRVLVVMGGTDPVGLTPVAVGLLARTGLALDVTVIAAGENAERVRAAAAGTALVVNVLAPVDDLPALMTDHDLVISAAGTSVWELCCIGVPLAVIWAVDNQREGYDRVVAAGAAVGLGGPELGRPRTAGPTASNSPRSAPMSGPRGSGPEGEGAAAERAVHVLRRALTDSRVRSDLVVAGREVVDGLGAWRVVRTWEMAQRHAQSLARRVCARASSADSSMADSAETQSSPAQTWDRLVTRLATLQDARLLWQWRNDPATRASSRSTGEVPWEDHLRWVKASLDRTDRRLLIIEEQLGTTGSVEAVGTVRWDLEGEGEWEVSITVAPDRRGRSLAHSALRAAELALNQGAQPQGKGASETDVTAYLAVVHVDNQASLRLFETSGYLPDLPPDSRGFMRFRKAARVA